MTLPIATPSSSAGMILPTPKAQSHIRCHAGLSTLARYSTDTARSISATSTSINGRYRALKMEA